MLRRSLIFFFIFTLLLVSCAATDKKILLKQSLIEAAYEGDNYSIEEILRKGADINVQNDYSCTVQIFTGMQYGLKGLVTVMDAINDPHPENNSTGLVAYLAFYIYGSIVDVMQFILKKWGDINMKNKAGNTPLMVAAYKGHKDTVAALLKNGADVNLKNRSGETVLMLANKKGDKQIIDLIKKAKPDELKQQKNLPEDKSFKAIRKVGDYVLDLLVFKSLNSIVGTQQF